MGCTNTVLTEMQEAGFKASTMLVFFVLREQMECHEDGRVPVARAWFMDKFGYSIKVVRRALSELEKAGFIAIERRRGNYSFARVTHRLKGRPEGRVQGRPEGRAVTVLEAEEKGRPEGRVQGRQKDLPGVTGVMSLSPGVDVVSSGVPDVLNVNGHAPVARPPTRKEKSEQGKALDDAAMKTPNLRDVTAHIETLYGVMTGFKFPWQKGKDFVRLAEKVGQYGAHTVMAACDYFFHRGNKWATEKGYRIDELIYQFGKLLDQKGLKERADRYQQGHVPVPVALETESIREPEKIELGIISAKRPVAQIAVIVEEERTHADLEQMHRQRVSDIGCKTRNCQFCKPQVSDAELMAIAEASTPC